MSSVAASNVCTRVRIVLKDGSSWHPKQLRNAQTGKVAFRLTPGGRYGNRLENTLEIGDEDEMIRMFLSRNYLVRAVGSSGRVNNYGIGRRSVEFVELDGKVV